MTEQERSNRRKAGKTILIKSDNEYSLNYQGILNVSESRSGAKFVVFDNVENASSALNDLTERNIRSKYSYYKLFFKLRDLKDDSTYDSIKNETIKKISEFDGDSNVLYYKLYRRNDVLSGCGDLVVDSKDTLDKLLQNKSLKINDKTEVTFYRFILGKNNKRKEFVEGN